MGRGWIWCVAVLVVTKLVTIPLQGQTAFASNSDVSSIARMVGGGTEFTSTSIEVNHGLDLHCNAAIAPNYLQVIWHDNVFVMTDLGSVSCSTDPAIQSGASFNTINGMGIGTLNGQSGAGIEFTFTDAGQPGVFNDTARIVIRGAWGFTTLEVSGKIVAGTHIAMDQ